MCGQIYLWVCYSSFVTEAKLTTQTSSVFFSYMYIKQSLGYIYQISYGPRQANLVLIAYASSEGSGEPAHPRSLARTFAARSYKQ